MPVDTRINIPFLPQEGITSQILSAIQLANEHAHQQQQLQLQQGQLGVQQQQANTQQAAQQSTSALQGVETQQKQAELTAGLPQAETDYKKAVAEHETLQTAFEKETNPLQKQLLANNLQNSSLDLQKKEVLLKLMTATQGPSMFDKQVDALVPPTGPNAALNQRTKINVASALQIGDLEGARNAIKNASTFLDEMDKTKYVQNRDDLREALNRQANKENQLGKNGLEQIDKMFTDPQHGYTQFLAQANATKADLSEAKNGSQLASGLAPLMTVLGVNSFAGVHRINPIEYATAGPELGSVYRRIDALLEKAGTGKMPEDTIKEMNKAVDDLITVKHASLVPAANMVVTNAGLDPKKTMIMDRDGKMVPLSDVGKSQAAPPAPPAGNWDVKVPGADGKLYWGNSKTQQVGPPVE